jgi:DNA-directed RNA polymerase specialized sigma24 family protein
MNTHCSLAVSLPHSNVAPPPQLKQMPEGRVNAAAFERFLGWLGPDPETAGQKYEVIRGRLIMMFRARRCVFAEDLADATFERVARKLTQLSTEFTGDPARYFYGVAKKIYMEYQHEITTVRYRSQISLPTPANACDPDLEHMLKQLDEALNTIPTSDRELILKYYTGTGRNKIDHRRALAEQFGMGLNALRLRVFRIRREIRDYILTGATPRYTGRRKMPQAPVAFHVGS